MCSSDDLSTLSWGSKRYAREALATARGRPVPRYDTRTQMAPTSEGVGLLAWSRVRDVRYIHRWVLFVDDFVVHPRHRGPQRACTTTTTAATRYARCLFAEVVRVAVSLGAVTHVALLVRRTATQQARARNFYIRVGLRATDDSTQFMFGPWADQVYMHATVDEVLVALRECAETVHPSIVFEHYDNTRRRWRTLLRSHASLIEALNDTHTTCEGGDGADAERVMSNSDVVTIVCRRREERCARC